MSQSAGDRQSQDNRGLDGESVPVQVVVERAVLVVLRHQPELRPGAAVCSSRGHKHSAISRLPPVRHVPRVCAETFVVSSNEAQDVFVSEHDGLVNLCLAEPRPLVPGGEDLHRHVLPSPPPPPHLPKPTLPDALLQDDGASDGPLHQQRQTCGTQKEEFGTEQALR